MSSTFQVPGDQNLNEEPEKEQQHDTFDHSVTAERDDRLPHRLAGVLLLLWNMSELSSLCSPSEDMANIKTSIKRFSVKEGEPSLLIESATDSELYVTHSGAQDSVGIHKFGKNRVGPANHEKEQQYLGLVLSTGRSDRLQDKVYAFYKEKNTDVGLDSDLWLPFVAQVCMADHGGSKTYLQFSWTSQLKARLFCGHHSTRQHFSELVEVATLHADRWQDVRVYALFRNEWGMSAVCVYTIQTIEDIFTNSKFKGYQSNVPHPRPGTCVQDSTKLPLDVLKVVESNSEMEESVQPQNAGPVLISHHHYTHISIDNFQNKGNYDHTVIFLSTESGRVHKVMKNNTQAFFITEYRPFTSRAHISHMILHHSARKLYVSSNREVVQLDVGSCDQYGDSCEECILARDPYCGWDGTRCTLDTPAPSAPSARAEEEEAADTITLPLRSRYFLRCPVSSLHAEYTWHHPKNLTACRPVEQQCLLLIDSMGPEQEGTYSCVSEEMGYTKTLAQYQLQLDSGAASPPVCVHLMAVVLMNQCSFDIERLQPNALRYRGVTR
ncbi:semaphorin-7A [Diretmus argenteus]